MGYPQNMDHIDFGISIMDVDLVADSYRALIALHQPGTEGDSEKLCLECTAIFPCATVRIIASFQEAAISRIANLESPVQTEKDRRETHRFLYPECPQFSGGICREHRETPLAAAT